MSRNKHAQSKHAQDKDAQNKHAIINADLQRFNSESLTVRMACSEDDIRQAQALRYHVFYEELDAQPSSAMAATGRDFDAVDAHADHLLVLDGEQVVGTYRLLRRTAARDLGQFYSADEYDLAPLLHSDFSMLELGRSCVHSRYRTSNTLNLLWRGIASYSFQYNIDLFFGCASFHGTDTEALALPFSYLYHHHLAPEDLRPRALPQRFVPMDTIPKARIDAPAVHKALPPLIKGYLRLGGWVGDGAVIDHQFHTTDIIIIVKTDRVTSRYYRRYREG